jgi:hypothetical protein
MSEEVEEESGPPPLTEADWEIAHGFIGKALDRRKLAWSVQGMMLQVMRDNGAVTLQLQELGDILRHTPPDQRKRMVNHWVRISLAKEDGIDITDFSQVRDRIRIKLFPEDIDVGDAELAEMRVMPGVRAVLALDMPNAVLALERRQVTPWGLEDRDTFGLGLHHVIHEEVTEETLEGPEGARIYVHSGPSHFVASRALALEHWVDNKHGAIVAVPNQHTLLFHPIEDARALTMIPALKMLAAPAYAGEPGPISPEVFWWLPGRIARIEVAEDPETGALALRPPPSFQEAMRDLGVDLATAPPPPEEPT